MLIIQSKRNKQLYPQLKVLGRGYHENAIERDRNHVPLEPKHAAEIAFLRTDDKQTALYVCTYLPTNRLAALTVVLEFLNLESTSG